MTEDQAQEVVVLLVAGFPAGLRHLDSAERKATMAVYRRMIVDLDFEKTKAAVERLAATAKFFPAIAEIREAVLVVAVGEHRSGADAWGDFLDAVHVYGRYRSPEFDDPLVADVVASMKWTALCDSDNHVADRARFIELYDHLARADRREAVTETLPIARSLKPPRPRGGLLTDVIRHQLADHTDEDGGKP